MKDFLNYDLRVGDQVVCQRTAHDKDCFKIGTIVGISANNCGYIVETKDDKGNCIVINRPSRHLIKIHKRFLCIVITSRYDSPCGVFPKESFDSLEEAKEYLDVLSRSEDEECLLCNSSCYKEYNYDYGVNIVYDYIDLNNREERVQHCGECCSDFSPITSAEFESIRKEDK